MTGITFHEVRGDGMQTKRVTLATLAVLVICSSAAPQESGFGIGAILGEPTGLTVKWWVGRSAAMDAAAAWSLGRRSALHLHLDYLLHNFNLFRVETGRLPLYYGIGGRIKFRDDDDDNVGLRIPVGMDYLFRGAPFDIFLEIVPLIDLIPSTDFDMNGSIGVRYWFR
jgi:hypothetical protein